MTIYLTDLENTGEAWIKSAQDCQGGDMIYLFYSRNYTRTSMDSIGPFLEKGVSLRCRKCATGKNGLDFQLCSELGYLVAQHPGCAMVILSNDHGYDALLHYWDRLGVHISRRSVDAGQTNCTLKKSKSKKKFKAASVVVPEPAGPSKTQCRKAYHAKLRPVLNSVSVTESELNKLIGICINSVLLNGPRRMVSVYNGCTHEYGRKRAGEIYKAGKEAIRDIVDNGPFYTVTEPGKEDAQKETVPVT